MNLVIILGLVVLCLLFVFVSYVIYWEIKLRGRSPLEISSLLIKRTEDEAKNLLHAIGATAVKSINDLHIQFRYYYGRQFCDGVAEFGDNECIKVKIIAKGMTVSDFTQLKPFNFDKSWRKVEKEGYLECYEMKIDPRTNKLIRATILQYYGINNAKYVTVEAIAAR